MENRIVVTTKDELQEIVESSMRRILKNDAKSIDQSKPDYLTVKQASAFLDLAEQTIYGLTSRNAIPFYKPTGKKLYFLKAELDQWLANGKQPLKEKRKIRIRKEGNL